MRNSQEPSTASRTCLNCSKEYLAGDRFCSACGQKTSTHRISLKHFLQHDLLHGVFHLDKGVPYTLKEAILRPGYAVANYLKGRRVRFYNVFYLTLLVIGLHLLIRHYTENDSATEVIHGNRLILHVAVIKYLKIVLFAFVPVFALNSWLLFRKLKYNYLEHVVIAGMLLLTFNIWLLIYLFTDILLRSGIFYEIKYYALGILSILVLFLPVQIYYQLTRKSYSLLGFSWRMILWYALLFTFILLALIALGQITNTKEVEYIIMDN